MQLLNKMSCKLFELWLIISCAAYDVADNMWTCEESAIIVKALVESMEKRVGESDDVSLDFVHQVRLFSMLLILITNLSYYSL